MGFQELRKWGHKRIYPFPSSMTLNLFQDAAPLFKLILNIATQCSINNYVNIIFNGTRKSRGARNVISRVPEPFASSFPTKFPESVFLCFQRSIPLSLLFPSFSHSEARRSISSFLEQSQMAFLLMLAMGCTLTLEGEKSAIRRQERTLWTAQWLLDSVRRGDQGSAIPLYIPFTFAFNSLSFPSSSLPFFPSLCSA